MSLQVNATTSYSATSKASSTKEKEEAVSATPEKTTGFDETAATYEKSDVSATVKPKTDYSAIVAQMKADAEARTSQLFNFVKETLLGQGNQLANADSIWSFLASGNYTVSEAARAQAQEAISEDGYWGVEQTSTRIVDFAKALAGDDASKADELLAAFKKGFSQATKTWGKELPDISKKTYEAVEKKFQAWKDEKKDTTTAASESTVS